jgi:hypothetical protein
VQIDWAVVCRYAESDGTVATIVGAGMDVLFQPQLPAPVGVMMAVRLAASAEEFEGGRTHTFTSRVLTPDRSPVRGPDGEEVPALEAEVGAQGPLRQLVPGWLVNPMIAVGVQWVAEVYGTYSVQVAVAGVEHLSPLHVLPPDAEPQDAI